MRINTNVAAINAQRNLQVTNASAAASMQKLSSGFRINRAADDAAGLGISNRFRADIRALNQAASNAEQANSVLSIAEGSTSNIQKMLERMKELASQAASDSVDAEGRGRIHAEFEALRNEITRTVDTTTFQGKKLLDGNFGNTLDSGSTILLSGSNAAAVNMNGTAAGSYTIANTGAGVLTLTSATVTQTASAALAGEQSVTFSAVGITVRTKADYDQTVATNTFGDVTVAAGTNGGSFMISSSGNYDAGEADNLTLDSLNLTVSTLTIGTSSLSTLTGAQTALGAIDTAMGKVAESLGKIGALQNRIEYALSSSKTAIQNFSAAESVIRDVDMAEEMTRFTKSNILAQAGTAMLAQANQSAQSVLSLLRG
jgi:flagellin